MRKNQNTALATASPACQTEASEMNYELTQHANDVLAEREIPSEWLERVLDAPEMVEPDKDDPQLIHHLAVISEHGNRVLRVVFNHQVTPVQVVTAYFDRKMKGKL